MKAEIEIEVYADISAEGIQRYLHIGDTCEPVFEDVDSR